MVMKTSKCGSSVPQAFVFRNPQVQLNLVAQAGRVCDCRSCGLSDVQLRARKLQHRAAVGVCRSLQEEEGGEVQAVALLASAGTRTRRKEKYLDSRNTS